MSTRASLPSFYNKMKNGIQLFYRYRVGQPSCATEAKLRDGYSVHQSLYLISGHGGSWRKQDPNIVKDDVNKVNSPPPPPPPKFNFSLWAKWLLGSILSMSLPFWKQKWNKLKQIEGEAEMVIEEAEKVAEVVEKVATVAENVSADVAEMLADHTKLKDAALFVEGVSKETAHDAQLTLNFIHKVDELKHDLTDVETIVEPVVDKIVHQ